MEVLLGKSSINGSFSIAMLNNQVVKFFFEPRISNKHPPLHMFRIPLSAQNTCVLVFLPGRADEIFMFLKINPVKSPCVFSKNLHFGWYWPNLG